MAAKDRQAYLSIDKDDSVHERESAHWLTYGISSVRVESMTDGIKKAMDGRFIFIGINADNITDYLSKLKILRDITRDPIFIGTSVFSVTEQLEALKNGADSYGVISESEINSQAILTVINNLQTRAELQEQTEDIIFYGDILIHKGFHKAFVKDKELSLNKTEMEILGCLALGGGKLITPEQIHKHVWMDNYSNTTSDILYSAIKRLRSKIREASGEVDYIESVRGVGYRLRM